MASFRKKVLEEAKGRVSKSGGGSHDHMVTSCYTLITSIPGRF